MKKNPSLQLATYLSSKGNVFVSVRNSTLKRPLINGDLQVLQRFNISKENHFF